MDWHRTLVFRVVMGSKFNGFDLPCKLRPILVFRLNCRPLVVVYAMTGPI